MRKNHIKIVCIKLVNLTYLSNCNIDILERFQSKMLRIITDAPRYVPNTVIRRDLKVSSVRQEVHNYSVTYRYRLDHHPNRLAKSLFQGPAHNRRLNAVLPCRSGN